MKMTQKIGMLLAALVLVGMNFIEPTESLGLAGIHTMGILVAVLILLITEPIPLGVTCLFSIALLVIFSAVDSFGEALAGFTNPIVFFVLVSFGISKAITKVPLSNRILKLLLKAFGKNVKLILLSIMIASAIISSVISNVATTAVFISLVIKFIHVYDDPADQSKTGKAFMIGLPVASMIGGMLTPAGSSLNLMTLSFIESLTGITVTFLQWMFIGVPVVLVVMPIAWQIIIRVYGIVEMDKARIDAFIDELDVPEKMDAKEKYVMILMIAMFTFWILGSWFPVFNITLVAIIGFTLLFLPNHEIITWDEFVSSVSWPAFFLVGTVITIGGALVQNGVSEWMVATFFPQTINLPMFGVSFVLGMLVFIMLVIVPVAPALIPILSGPFVGIAANMGISPVLTMMTMGLVVANCYLLPLDTVPLLTYITGYYKMVDMPKSTVLIQVFVALVVALWVPIAVGILGFSG